MNNIIINAAAFQLGWLRCVLTGANHLPWFGTATDFAGYKLGVVQFPDMAARGCCNAAADGAVKPFRRQRHSTRALSACRL